MFLDLIDSFKSTLGSFGLEAQMTNTFEMPYHTVENDIVILVGIVGQQKGILTFEYDLEASKEVIRIMMPGMNLNPLDEMVLSALSEIGNICGGTFLAKHQSKNLDLTPPTLIVGKNMKAMINNYKTFRVYVSLSAGTAVLSLSSA